MPLPTSITGLSKLALLLWPLRNLVRLSIVWIVWVELIGTVVIITSRLIA